MDNKFFYESDDGDDSDGWEEIEVLEEQPPTICLFCPLEFPSVDIALTHCQINHNFNLSELKLKHNMDFYSFLKMINYIRLHKPHSQTITECCTPLWNDEVYLKPGKTESWLMYDFEDLNHTDGMPIDFEKRISELTRELQQKNDLLKNAKEDIVRMRELVRSAFDDENCDNKISVPKDSSGYFSSYSHFGIHHEMLSDTVKTTSYRKAILKNKDSFQDKIVLDVGCGTSILSLFSSDAGAKQVYGIDQSDVIYKAMEIVRENNIENVNLIRGRIEDVKLPVEKVDILISEWMGYFLFFEGMLDSIVYGRDRYLSQDGLILPSRCNLSLVGVSDTELYEARVTFWENVYGYSMRCMTSDVIQEANVETVPSDKIISTSSLLYEIDLKTCSTSAVEFSSNFKLNILKNSTLTALAGYFDTFFDLNKPIEFSSN